MDSRQTSFDLLAHFDRPKTVDLPDFEWTEEILSNEPPASSIQYFDPTASLIQEVNDVPTATRGARWVLQWAAALAVLTFATCILTEFAYLMAAEYKLTLAARAGVLEATLPRASYRSVTAAIERRLTDYPLLLRQLQLTFTQNGSPAPRQFGQSEGDRFSIMLVAPNSAVLPEWLRTIMFWRTESRIQAHAEMQLPGRRLSFGAGLPTSPKR
jgi:hypothetical protein